MKNVKCLLLVSLCVLALAASPAALACACGGDANKDGVNKQGSSCQTAAAEKKGKCCSSEKKEGEKCANADCPDGCDDTCAKKKGEGKCGKSSACAKTGEKKPYCHK